MKRAFYFIQISLLVVFINLFGTVTSYGRELSETYVATFQPKTQIDQQVTPGTPAKFKIASEEQHRIVFSLNKGELLHVVVEQDGIDVEVALFNSKNKCLEAINITHHAFTLWNQNTGTEYLSYLANTAEKYQISVTATGFNHAGLYRISAEIIHHPSQRDLERLKAEQLVAKGSTLLMHGDTQEEAVSVLQQALPVWRQVEDKSGEALTRYLLGCSYKSFDREKSKTALTESLALWQAVGNKSQIATTLYALANSSWESSREVTQQRINHYGQIRAIYQETNDYVSEAELLQELTQIYDYSMKDPQKVRELHQEIIRIFQANHDKQKEADAWHSLGLDYDPETEIPQILETGFKKLQLYRELKDFHQVVLTLRQIGDLYRKQGDVSKAVDSYQQGIAVSVATDPYLMVDTTLLLIDYFGEINEPAKALELAQGLINLVPQMDPQMQFIAVRAFINAGCLYQNLDQHQKALDMFTQGLTTFKTVQFEQQQLGLNNPEEPSFGNQYTEMGLLAGMASAQARLGLRTESLENINQALKIVKQAKDQFQMMVGADLSYVFATDLIESLARIVLYHSIGDKQKTIDALGQTLKILQKEQQHQVTEENVASMRRLRLLELQLQPMMATLLWESGRNRKFEEYVDQIRLDQGAFLDIVQNETAAQEAVYKIRELQQMYQTLHQTRAFATRDELVRSSGCYIFGSDESRPGRQGYLFELKVSEDRSRYELSGVPVKYGQTGMLSFYLDSKGGMYTLDNKGRPISEADRNRLTKPEVQDTAELEEE